MTVLAVMNSMIRVDKTRGRWRIIFLCQPTGSTEPSNFKSQVSPGLLYLISPGRCENAMMLACNLSLTDKSAHLKVTLTKQTLKQADTLFCILNTFSTRLVCQNFRIWLLQTNNTELDR